MSEMYEMYGICVDNSNSWTSTNKPTNDKFPYGKLHENSEKMRWHRETFYTSPYLCMLDGSSNEFELSAAHFTLFNINFPLIFANFFLCVWIHGLVLMNKRGFFIRFSCCFHCCWLFGFAHWAVHILWEWGKLVVPRKSVYLRLNSLNK